MIDAQHNPPAFPTTKPLEGWGDPNQGMSLRDWFAGQALIGLIVASAIITSSDADVEASPMDAQARDAYRHADYLLAERARSKHPTGAGESPERT